MNNSFVVECVKKYFQDTAVMDDDEEQPTFQKCKSALESSAKEESMVAYILTTVLESYKYSSAEISDQPTNNSILSLHESLLHSPKMLAYWCVVSRPILQSGNLLTGNSGISFIHGRNM